MSQRTVLNLAVLGFLGSAIASTAVWSQTLPPAGEVGKHAQPSFSKREANSIEILPASKPAKPTRPTLLNHDAKVHVVGFSYSGVTVLQKEELDSLVAPYINQELDITGFDKLANAITQNYHDKGYIIARAFVPTQESIDGIIKVVVIEGRIGSIRLKNTSVVNSARLTRMAMYNLCDTDNTGDGKDCSGKLLQNKGLERSILILKDLPGTTAVAHLEAGQTAGTSDLDVEVQDTKRQAYTLGVDNFGSISTGLIRINATADINNLRADGDQLSLGLATTTLTQTKTGGISYTLPAGYSGQRMGMAYSRNQYRLGAGFSVTQSNGFSNALSIFTTYPLVRSVSGSLYARASIEVRGGINSVDAASTSYKTSANVLRLGMNGDAIDGFSGGGFSVYGFTLSGGYIRTSDAIDSSTAGAKTAGHFNKIAYNFTRQQTITNTVSLLASLNGQRAIKNLDGSEQTGLGGPASTRGYGSEAGGSTGANSTLELRYSKPFNLGGDPSSIGYGLFIDRGWVQLFQNPPTTQTEANTRALSSYGVTFTIQSQPKIPTPTSWGYFLRAMYGKHSSAQPSGVDPTSQSKFWLQAGINF